MRKPDFNEFSSFPLLGLMFFWALHAISLFYSLNISSGFSDIVQKLSFVLLPIIFLTSKDVLLPYSKKIAMAFVYGLLVLTILLLANAAHNSIGYTPEGFVVNPVPADAFWENYFLHTRLSMGKHPTYLSMFFAFGIAILFTVIKRDQTSRLENSWIGFFILLFSLMIVLLASRTGVIFGLIVVVSGVLWLFLRKNIWLNLFLLASIMVLISLFAVNNSRFVIILQGLGVQNLPSVVEDKDFEQTLIEANMIRIRMWRAIPEVMDNHWLFGYGAGDSKQALVNGYGLNQITLAYENKYNAHNQFLETLVCLGLVGMLTFAAILFTALYFAIKRRYYLFLFFLVIIVVSSTFESIFERISGVLFFGFFFSYLLTLKVLYFRKSGFTVDSTD